jgi:hypothetical protein
MARKTVTHPDPRISSSDALKSLQEHPAFVPGTKIVDFKKQAGQYVAELEIPEKTAEFPPKDDESGPPSDDAPVVPKDDGDDGAPEAPSESDGPPKGDDDGPSDGDGPKKPSVEEAVSKLTDLVTQIAEAVGVHPHLGDEGLDAELGPHAGPGPDGPPVDGPPAAGPPHGAPKPPPAKPPLRPGMAPPGATPVGAPSFASVPHPLVGKVRSFVVANKTDDSLDACKEQVEAKFGPFGYKVRQIVETSADGSRTVRAKISR